MLHFCIVFLYDYRFSNNCDNKERHLLFCKAEIAMNNSLNNRLSFIDQLSDVTSIDYFLRSDDALSMQLDSYSINNFPVISIRLKWK